MGFSWGQFLVCRKCNEVHAIEEITPNICPKCRLYNCLTATDEDAYLEDLMDKIRKAPSIAGVEIITSKDVEAMSEQSR